MDSGTVENCTVEDGTKISASSSESYVGGIAGYANEAAMTGNTWPKSIYSAEVGSDYVVIIPEHKDTTSWNGHRYQIFSDFVSWEEAKARCESLGGHLAKITSQEDMQMILACGIG